MQDRGDGIWKEDLVRTLGFSGLFSEVRRAKKGRTQVLSRKRQANRSKGSEDKVE